MFDNIMKNSLLYDFYGNLLSDRQREVMRLYHEENLSLGEIAKEFGISRQGVYDALKHAEKSLVEFENKLALLESFQKRENIKKELLEDIDKILALETVDTKADIKKLRDKISLIEI